LIVPVIARLSGLQATVDSKAAQMRVRSPEAGAPVAVHREVIVAEVEGEVPVAEVAAEGVASRLWLSSGNSYILRKSSKEYRSSKHGGVMMCRDKIGSEKPLRCRCGLATVIISIITIAAFGISASAQDIKQKTFRYPKQALKALIEAARDNDTAALLAIFGPEGKDMISSGDAVADERGRERFVRAAEEAIKFSRLDDKTVLAVIGKDKWILPVPIVKSGKGWIFSTKDGKEEVINRRIGRNELNTIQVCLNYVTAQREYASKDRNGDGVLQFAQHFLSNKDKKDGLYWEAAPGEDMSPLGPLIARASEEGYSVKKENKKPRPYHGYYFRILKGQGKNAEGGEIDYIKDGKMVAGFALEAYPAIYGVSGIMTFMVNQAGIVYEKDLGPKTEEIAKETSRYDTDETWKEVQRIRAAQK